MPRRARTTPARLLATVLAILLTGVLAVSLGGSAEAGPKQSLARVKHSITAEKHRLAQLQARAEAAAERYNSGRLELARAQRVAADKRAAATAAQHRLTAMRAQLSVFAVQMYKGGDPAALALLDQAQDPQAFVDRAAYSEQLAQQKAATLASLRTAEQDATVTAEAARQALAAQQAVVRRLAAAKHEVDVAARQAQAILGDLRRKQHRLVHEIQVQAARAAAARRRAAAAAARRAAEQARAEELALAQQQAAAEAARQHFDSAPADPDPAPAPATSSGGSGNAAAIAVDWARRELGKPYVWAAAGPDSFDCSGLTMYVYAKAGVYLPHSSGAQYGYGSHVSRSQLSPGDLVFFGSPIHHVGIYIGGGQMIEAPHTGADVRVSGVDRSDYVGATRVAG